jgi:hypothetical protein
MQRIIAFMRGIIPFMRRIIASMRGIIAVVRGIIASIRGIIPIIRRIIGLMRRIIVFMQRIIAFMRGIIWIIPGLQASILGIQAVIHLQLVNIQFKEVTNMGQDRQAWEEEWNLKREQTHDTKTDEAAPGKPLAVGDGTVGDTEVEAITGHDRRGKPTGQDHSTDHHEEMEPDQGVGAVQSRNDPDSDVAHICD